MFSRVIEKEQWYVFKGYRKRAVVCFQEVLKEQWYVFKGYRKRTMVCFQRV